MAKNKKKAKSTDDIVMDAMPGGEVKTEKDIESFQVDLNFEDEAAPEEAVAEEVVEAPVEDVDALFASRV